MSFHIGARKGGIAEAVLITGDPLRAKFIAEAMLTDVTCYSEVRGMLGFTGLYKGERISVQGTGMGIPSTAIYVHELIHDYDVRRIIRVGTCGAIQKELQLGQLVLATEAYTDSALPQLLSEKRMQSMASATLTTIASMAAQRVSVPLVSGPVFSTDLFYGDEAHRWSTWTARGVLAIEMETAVLYTLAAKHGIDALTLLTVSDNILTSEFYNAGQREQASRAMMTIALETALEH
jgi:purine-nucleoside phosphorylase